MRMIGRYISQPRGPRPRTERPYGPALGLPTCGHQNFAHDGEIGLRTTGRGTRRGRRELAVSERCPTDRPPATRLLSRTAAPNGQGSPILQVGKDRCRPFCGCRCAVELLEAYLPHLAGCSSCCRMQRPGRPRKTTETDFGTSGFEERGGGPPSRAL